MKKILFALLILAIIPSALAIGIGLAPIQIDISNAFRGGEYERTITIFNPSESTGDFIIRAEGEAKDWISFYNTDSTSIDNISISSNGNYVILMKIKIPEDSGSQIYNSTIYVETAPKDIKNIETGAVARLVATSDVMIQVTGDQIMDGAVRIITVDDTEPNFPVKISAIFQNTGNVVATPKIYIEIIKDQNVITNFIDENIKIRPGLTGTIISQWNTTPSTILGDYNANVVVFLDNKELKSENLTFKVLPIGTLSRKGNLTEIAIDGKPEIGTTIKIKGHFQNAGQIDTIAKLNAEVYKDNKLIENIASDELEVKKGEDVFLTSYLKITSAGKYDIKGKVTYSGKNTETKSVSFKIDKSFLPGFDITLVIIIMILIYTIQRKKEESNDIV